jgi:2-keto-4-pentenoate hydratase/2-oxohepta-3-ene-1,7-dioic acid hydratase in catechol pathway
VTIARFVVDISHMRYATFSTTSDTTPRLGIVSGDQIVDVSTLDTDPKGPRRMPGTRMPGSLLELIQSGPDGWRRMADLASDLSRGRSHPAGEVRWHAPIPRPAKNVFCLGRNYADHVKEAARARGQDFKLPSHPVFFTKAPTSVIGPHDDIVWDVRVTQQVDWEAELGVILGSGGINISRGAAMAHVFGYTVINDISARDLQTAHAQFFKGKSLDTFCPMGPVVVTADEYGDPQAKDVLLRVNGVEKQHGNTADMIFPIDQTIEWLSAGLTLEAGDIISTGTPEGVGMGRTPQEWLKVGDVMETEVEGIGILRNRVVSA